MAQVNRRHFMAAAAALGACSAWASDQLKPSDSPLTERRDLYPEGVASGDPDAHSVLLWTRRPYSTGTEARLRVEVAEDREFTKLVSRANAKVSAASDWTCRVLVGNLKPSRIYWYRFIDAEGFTSRVGRTATAPAPTDGRPVRFAFVSCQNINMGAQHAYRRMIFEDERAGEKERVEFVVHLGDFIYESVWYPEDRPKGMYDRRIRDIVRYPQGEKISDFHIPVTLDDYRAIYRAYLHDRDIQDARARWPFVSMWDNHEFSWRGWQSLLNFNDRNTPGQTRKVAANQCWFEYQPARVSRPGQPSLEEFAAPRVVDAPIAQFDAQGLGTESNNLAAIGSLTGYRALVWGRHLELLLTDQRSYRSEEPIGRPEAEGLTSKDFPELFPEEGLRILDAGRAWGGGHPPAEIRFGGKAIANFRKDDPPQTLLGTVQKKWFLDRLKASRATWKIWGNTLGTLDYRIDPQNLPAGLTQPWPGAGYAGMRAPDASTAYVERAEIYSVVRREKITGFATIAGDRHSFWAGLAAADLPPQPFEPVGIGFVVGSISSPGLLEKLENNFPASHPLRPLYLAPRASAPKPDPAINLLLRHGVRACLEYQRTGDIRSAREQSNRLLSPHLSFVDVGGHGFATVRVSAEAFECEFVCIPRPSEPVDAPDGGPVLYRVTHRARMWKPGEAPSLEQRVHEGAPDFSI